VQPAPIGWDVDVGVHDRQVLDVGARPTLSGASSPRKHAAEPDAAVLAQRHVARDDRVGGHPRAAFDAPHQAQAREEAHGAKRPSM
jgi:hypothetical protein